MGRGDDNRIEKSVGDESVESKFKRERERVVIGG